MSTKRTPPAQLKFHYVIDYRWMGHWLPIGGAHRTKPEAKEYAESSQCCMSFGYQIRRIQNPKWKPKR